MQMLAWHAANVMNVHTKKQITVKKLLGKEKRPMTKEERQAAFEKVREQMKRVAERREAHDTNRRNIS